MNNALRVSVFIICFAPYLSASSPGDLTAFNESSIKNVGAFQENFDTIMKGDRRQQRIPFTDTLSLTIQEYLQYYIKHLKESHNHEELGKIEIILKKQQQSLMKRTDHIQGLVHYVALKKFSDLRRSIIALGFITGIEVGMMALIQKALQAIEYKHALERLLWRNNLHTEIQSQSSSFSKTSDTGPEIIQSIKDILKYKEGDSQFINKVALIGLGSLGVGGIALILEGVFKDYESELKTIDLKTKYIDHLLSFINSSENACKDEAAWLSGQ